MCTAFSTELTFSGIYRVEPLGRHGFPCSSAGKESTCNAGDLSSIPGSGSFSGEGIGYPLQYSWASLVAQTVKNPPARQETWVGSLGWEDPLEKGSFSILAWRIPVDRGAWQGTVHGVAESWAQLSTAQSASSRHGVVSREHLRQVSQIGIRSYGSFSGALVCPLSIVVLLSCSLHFF